MGLLDGKTAVVYGAAGGVGNVVAKTFAHEGATVHLAGRTPSSLESVAKEISTAGGRALVDKVDALNPKEVEDHLQRILARSGKLDVSVNLMSTSIGMGKTLTQLSDEQFNRVAFNLVRSNFITATAAARQMEKQGSGVILGLTADVARLPRANLGGFPIAGAAMEALWRQLALEAGPKGVRVLCLRSTATPDNPTFEYVFTELAKVGGTTKEEVEKSEAKQLALKRLPQVREVANAMVLMASDYASAITATAVYASCGEVVD